MRVSVLAVKHSSPALRFSHSLVLVRVSFSATGVGLVKEVVSAGHFPFVSFHVPQSVKSQSPHPSAQVSAFFEEGSSLPSSDPSSDELTLEGLAGGGGLATWTHLPPWSFFGAEHKVQVLPVR